MSLADPHAPIRYRLIRVISGSSCCEIIDTNIEAFSKLAAPPNTASESEVLMKVWTRLLLATALGMFALGASNRPTAPSLASNRPTAPSLASAVQSFFLNAGHDGRYVPNSIRRIRASYLLSKYAVQAAAFVRSRPNAARPASKTYKVITVGFAPIALNNVGRIIGGVFGYSYFMNPDGFIVRLRGGHLCCYFIPNSLFCNAGRGR